MNYIECIDLGFGNKLWIKPDKVEWIAETAMDQELIIPTHPSGATPPIKVIVPKGSYNIGFGPIRFTVSKEDGLKILSAGPPPPIYVLDARQLFNYTP